MSYTDTPVTLTTFTAGDYRARVVVDIAPNEPEDDGSFPILRFERDEIRELDVTSYRLPSSILAAARYGRERWDDPQNMFARYLRAMHGTTTITTWHHPEDYSVTYMAFDTAEWREFTGATPGPDLVATMGDWEHYVNGDVFDVVVERCVRDVTADHWEAAARFSETDTVTGADVRRLAHANAVLMDSYTWDHVTIVGGYYGDEWARQAAREALADYTDDEITEES